MSTARKKRRMTAKEKYWDWTTYKDPDWKTKKRISHPWTQRWHNYCTRSFGQKKTEKVRQRRKDWWCKWKRSYK